MSGFSLMNSLSDGLNLREGWKLNIQHHQLVNQVTSSQLQHTGKVNYRGNEPEAASCPYQC